MAILAHLKEQAKRLKAEAFTLYFAYRDKRTPWLAKVLIGLTLGYLFSPIDLIPDFIPVLGLLDDLILVPLLIRLSLRLIPGEVITESRQKAYEAATHPTPANSWFAGVIILIWLTAALGAYWLFFTKNRF